MAKVVTIEELVVRDGELHIRQISAEVADIYDSLLADNDIMVPDVDRTGDEDEAPLYGSTYSDFEDGITDELADIVSGIHTISVNMTAAKEAIYESFVALLQRHNIPVPGDKDELFQAMDSKIQALVTIALKYPTLPVNTWEY